ncbi:MAG: 23S rRNA (guanosine-2'-O-)-methyltransferase RlmB [Chlamydiae bacterium]|nr:23S rRNA (guanosine-2'-O-)-methyltransferase RlmB [Chlamydiota bacterium]
MTLITSSQNSLIKHLIKLQKVVSYRKECQSIFLEGKKLVEEACSSLLVKHCFIEEGKNTIGSYPTTFISESVVSKLSSLKSSDGYFAEVEKPLNNDLRGSNKIIVLDGLQNPGNLGTLIRTALAFGYDGAFILDESVDPFSPKVIRASMGACLQLPICIGSESDLLDLAHENKMDLFTADASGTPIDETSPSKPFMLILGNESKGSQLNLCSTKVSLPIECVDSLNVAIAGSLLMYLMKGFA